MNTSFQFITYLMLDDFQRYMRNRALISTKFKPIANVTLYLKPGVNATPVRPNILQNYIHVCLFVECELGSIFFKSYTIRDILQIGSCGPSSFNPRVLI